MSITAKLGALGAAIVALVMGLAACQTSGTVTTIVTDKGEETFTSWLAKPEGEGPFPAIVLLHGCSGTQWNTSHRTARRGLNGHARLLNDYGYVTLVVDGCQTGGKHEQVQVSDANAAFDYLAALPFVDADRIGSVGLALGGSTASQLPMRGPRFVEVMGGRPHTVTGNSAARKDSQTRMLAFFAKHLGGPYPAAAGDSVDAAGHSGFGNFLRAAFARSD